MIAAALVSMLWAQTAAPAPAPPLPIDLRWDAPAGCPEAVAVRAGIARGLPAAPPGSEPMLVSVVVRALDADHWQAALELRGVDWTATRTLKGASCAAVADAVGLVIGLAFTSELASRPVVVAPPPPPPPPVHEPSSAVASLAFVAESGELPSATVGGALGLGWRWTRALVEVRGSLFAPRTASVAAFPDTGGRLWLASLAARDCALWGQTLSGGVCVGVGVDRIAGTGTGPIATAAVTSWVPFLGSGLRGEWRVSRWVATFLDLEDAIPLVRARFSVKNIGLVHQADPVSFRGAAGLLVRFR
jgi:hypothetical protein